MFLECHIKEWFIGWNMIIERHEGCDVLLQSLENSICCQYVV